VDVTVDGASGDAPERQCNAIRERSIRPVLLPGAVRRPVSTTLPVVQPVRPVVPELPASTTSQARRRCGTSGRAVVGHQSEAADQTAEERGGVDVRVAVAQAEVEVGCGDPDDRARRDRIADAQGGTGEPSVGRAATIGVPHDDVAFAGDGATERDLAGRHGGHDGSAGCAVLEPPIAGAPCTRWESERVDHRGVDRREPAGTGRDRAGRREPRQQRGRQHEERPQRRRRRRRTSRR
jgi:hypothetical protein